MVRDRDDCARAKALLARLDAAAAGGGDEPGAVLAEVELDWLAAHLESCPACAPAPQLLASLGDALQPAASELPDDTFFATRRASLLDAIRATDVDQGARAVDANVAAAVTHAARTADAAGAVEPARGAAARDGGVVGAGTPARGATRPVLRAVPGSGTRTGARGPRPARRRSLWRPLLPALAAGLAIVVALGVLRARTQRPGDADVAAIVEVASGDLVAVVDDGAGDDSWVVQSDDLFEVALSSTSDPALDELSDDDLDEIEGVFVPSPGWS